MLEKFNCAYTDVLPLKDIIPHEKNRNKHSEEQVKRLAKIIKFQGQRHPIIISTLSGKIVAGHCRAMAIKKLGWGEAAVDYQDFIDEEQEYLFMQSDNAIAEWAEPDLAGINQDIQDLGPFDIELLGFENFVVDMSEKLDPKTDEDEVPEVKKVITKRGDIWILGNHRLMCGDSTMIDDVEKLMKGEKADMVFTDPPYGVNYKSNWKNSVSNKEILNDDRFITEWISSIGGYCFCRFDSYSILEASLKEFGHKIFTVIVWDKLSHTAGDLSSWANTHEFIVYFGSKKTTTKREQNVARFRRLDNGATGESAKDNMVHPTQKPIELIEYIFECEPHKFIHDPFLGSGSTLIACEKTNRKCYGMELDEHYCDVIINRWQNYTGKDAVLDGTGQKYKDLSK